MRALILSALALCACVGEAPYSPLYYTSDSIEVQSAFAEPAKLINDAAGCKLVQWSGNVEISTSIEVVDSHAKSSLLGCAFVGDAWEGRRPITIVQNGLMPEYGWTVSLLTHEILHSIGLHHLDETSPHVMAPYLAEQTDSRISLDPVTVELLRHICDSMQR